MIKNNYLGYQELVLVENSLTKLYKILFKEMLKLDENGRQTCNGK